MTTLDLASAQHGHFSPARTRLEFLQLNLLKSQNSNSLSLPIRVHIPPETANCPLGKFPWLGTHVDKTHTHTSEWQEMRHSRRPAETRSMSSPTAEEYRTLQARIWHGTGFRWRPLTSAFRGAASVSRFRAPLRWMTVWEPHSQWWVWHSWPGGWPTHLPALSSAVSFGRVLSALLRDSLVS